MNYPFRVRTLLAPSPVGRAWSRIPARVIQYAWDNTDEDASSSALRHLLIRHMKLSNHFSDFSQLKDYFVLTTSSSKWSNLHQRQRD
jgi:hypothetical protein